jgi:CheY-like chemotaxis protein
VKVKAKSKEYSILAIDDNSDILDLQKTVLELAGYEVHVALGGQEALDALRAIAPPDLILLDFQMEQMSGPEFLRELEKERPEILRSVPVVFLTGMNEVPKTKAAGFIRKPAEMDEFVKEVQRFIELGQRAPYKTPKGEPERS